MLIRPKYKGIGAQRFRDYFKITHLGKDSTSRLIDRKSHDDVGESHSLRLL